MKKISRREFLNSTGVYGLAMLISACLPQIEIDSTPTVSEQTASKVVDLEFRLTAMADKVQIFPGEATSVWRYQGEVMKGEASNLVAIENSYIGPIFHVRKGQIVRIHFDNELSEKSIIHWHGLHVPVEADGHPRFAIEPGESYVSTFEVKDRAGTYWFHPHPHGRTGPQVYAGLAGLFIVHDEEEYQLGLPSGEYDLPMVIQDRQFSDSNQLEYAVSSMMMQMTGFLGNRILVNGIPSANYQLKKGVYRLRLLNGSNSRIYQLAWEDGRPLTVIGTDGGLLESPIVMDSVTLAPAQRIEFLVDFREETVGTTREFINLPHNAPGGGGHFSLFSVEIIAGEGNDSSLPDQLTTIAWEKENEAVNYERPRKFSLAMGRGMVFTLNGRVFSMEDVADNEVVHLGDLEIWQFENELSGMGMMGNASIPHPIHVHGLQFQIIERDWSNVDQSVWGSLAMGNCDAGWHDTMLVYPGEKVKILLKFKDFTGLYLYHCHNLEHEDMGMMRNFLIEA